MIEILDLNFYTVYHVKYIQKYWVVGKIYDSLEHVCQGMSEALSMAQALDGSASAFMSLEAE